MHRQVKIVLLVALTTCTLLALTPPSVAENPRVSVLVYDDAQVPADTLTRAEQRAATIFSSAGLNVIWVNCIHGGAAACDPFFDPLSFVLLIAPDAAPSTADAIFGVAFLGPDGTGRNTDVFWKKVQELQTNSKVDTAILLGCVMAHEMGHLLLGPNAHAVSGIMQPHWQDWELRNMSMGTLRFLPEQGRRMRARVARRITARTFEPDSKMRLVEAR